MRQQWGKNYNETQDIGSSVGRIHHDEAKDGGGDLMRGKIRRVSSATARLKREEKNTGREKQKWGPA